MVIQGGISVCEANNCFCSFLIQGIAVVVERDLFIARARDAVVPKVWWKVAEKGVGD